MIQQQRLFNTPAKPRAKPRVMMHVIDIGLTGFEPKGFEMSAEFKCDRCGHEGGWIACKNMSEVKRGKPCPKCNQRLEAE